MKTLVRRELHGRVATVSHSTRSTGDLSTSQVHQPLLDERRAAAVALPWRAVRQIHSDRVVVVGHGDDDERPFADALMTNETGLVLAVHSGDCVPVGLLHQGGAVAAAHAGWKGLEAGVLESTVRTLRARYGVDHEITAAVGPHIRAAQYEFGDRDLDRLALRFGPHVRSQTAEGAPALDLTAAIASELARLDVAIEASSPDCTGVDAENYWSHRARQETGRIALVVWLEKA